jgi:hypothetical protein
MLPDRERDILRVQAKNLVIELQRQFEAEKLEGREDATKRGPTEDYGVPTPTATESIGGGRGGSQTSG